MGHVSFMGHVIFFRFFSNIKKRRDFPGDPVAKNPPSSVGVVGSIPVQELRPQMQLRSNRGKSINKIQPTQRASWSRCSWASSKRQEHTCSKTGNRVTRKVSSALIRLWDSLIKQKNKYQILIGIILPSTPPTNQKKKKIKPRGRSLLKSYS